MENNEKELMTTEEDMDKNDTANSNKEESREFYVYKHIRKDNNTCFYVGKGKGRRMYVPKRNKHFNRIRKKYGCYVVKIKENLTEKEAFALEREIIEDYVFVFGYGINIKGYRDYSDKKYLTNCTWGGEGTSGMHHSEETKRKIGEKNSEALKGKNAGKNPYAGKTEEEMVIISKKKSEAMKGEKNPMFGKNPYAGKTEEEMEEIGKKISEKISGERHPMFGKHYSEEHNKKISEAKKGIKNSEEHNKNISKGMKGIKRSEEAIRKTAEKHRKKVTCITTGETFDSIKDASNHYKVAKSSIVSCCKEKRKHAGKLNGVRLQWKYLEDDYNDLKAV